jgi:hypothetical protein
VFGGPRCSASPGARQGHRLLRAVSRRQPGQVLQRRGPHGRSFGPSPSGAGSRAGTPRRRRAARVHVWPRPPGSPGAPRPGARRVARHCRSSTQTTRGRRTASPSRRACSSLQNQYRFLPRRGSSVQDGAREHPTRPCEQGLEGRAVRGAAVVWVARHPDTRAPTPRATARASCSSRAFPDPAVPAMTTTRQRSPDGRHAIRVRSGASSESRPRGGAGASVTTTSRSRADTPARDLCGSHSERGSAAPAGSGTSVRCRCARGRRP